MTNQTPKNLTILFFKTLFILISLGILFFQCEKPDQEIVLKRIKDVVVDASSEPMLKANAVFYNPNKVKGKLKKIKVDIYVNGKKAAEVDQDLKTLIPSQSEFTVPLQVKLAIKDLGFMDTLLGVIGGKKFDVRYEGYLRLNYRGIPIKVPVDYKDEVKIRF
jgi:LEA14-like dessication related protein